MITIQVLTKEDCERVVEIEEELLEETLGVEMLQAELHNKYAKFYTAKDQNLVVGYIGCWIIEGTTDMINFVVDKNYQHKGIGQLLMKRVIDESLKENAKEILLEVREKNIQAINFYKLQGFKEITVRKEYYKNKDNALILRKELS